MEKKLEINGREFTVKELLYKDVISLSDVDKKELSKKMLFLATDITEDEWNTLSIKDGIQLQKAVNELNKLDELGFQNITKE